MNELKMLELDDQELMDVVGGCRPSCCEPRCCGVEIKVDIRLSLCL
jgi:hypothetical protein